MSRFIRTIIAALVAFAALSLTAAAASAHVTAQPPQQTAGGYTKITIRVPVEKDVATTKVEVQFPQSTGTVSYMPVPGWKVDVASAKLEKPIKDEDGNETDSYTSTITWSGGVIEPGQFGEFAVSLKLPEHGDLGDYVFFPAVQTYADGSKVRWNQKPAKVTDDPFSLDSPAPFVTLATSGKTDDNMSHDTKSAGADSDAVTKADLGPYAKRSHITSEINTARLLAIIGIVLAAIALGLAAASRRRRS